MIPTKSNSPANSLEKSVETAESTPQLEDTRPTIARIRLRIPKQYHQDPVISRLVSHHGVTVNIAAALLSANARDDGWFDLELQGTTHQLESALTYLNELDLEIWKSDTEQDGW